MYDLKRVSDTEWSISRNKQEPFVGDLKSVCEVAIAFGFEMEDIVEGIDEMAWMEHDTAHFGVYRRFIISLDTKEVA